MRSPIAARRALHVALVGLVVLHVVPVPGPDGAWLGFLPWDLAYPLMWMLAATGVVFYMTGPPWPDEPPPERQPPPDVPGGPR